MQELPTEEKEGYLTRATLLMHNQPMVSIVVVMDVFFLQMLIPRRRRRVPAAPSSDRSLESKTTESKHSDQVV